MDGVARGGEEESAARRKGRDVVFVLSHTLAQEGRRGEGRRGEERRGD